MRLILAALAVLIASPALAQSDLNLSGFAALTTHTTYQGSSYDTNNAAGLQAGFRHVSWPWWGYEASYSFNQFNLKQPYTQDQNQHSILADYVASFPVLSLRPFVLAGGGAAILTGTSTNTHGLVEYGAGTDIAVIPHLGLRLQFREQLLYGSVFPGTSGILLRQDRPMAGVYFKF